MNINTENKLHELSVYANMSLNNVNTNKQQNLNINNNENKNDNNSSSTITRIKRKASTMNCQQRQLQNRISDIQTQEAKVHEMEKALENAKYSYSENLKNEKRESSNIKVKIKQLAKKEDELETKSNQEISNKSIDNQHEDEKVISIIEDTMNKIEKVKSQIAAYKSKLISLEQSVEQALSKLESSKELIEKDFITDELGFISIEENVNTGIIINIAI